ncbi:MAG: hypothetical protein R3266_01865 [Gemmatimonadota bacterium]|nr:hypothetical protein [Gemmatimonadota bacterium]
MRRARTLLFLTALVWGLATLPAPRPALAQASGEETAAETWPEADPEDVASMDAIVAALYDVISGPAGEPRDWERFKSLHIPEARLIPSGRGPSGIGFVVLSPEEYSLRASSAFEQSGFYEVEIARTTERFGHIAHLFSTYESRRSPDDAEPFQRGINSIQLLHDGDRWWILNIFWTAERPDLPIPDRYLDGRP